MSRTCAVSDADDELIAELGTTYQDIPQFMGPRWSRTHNRRSKDKEAPAQTHVELRPKTWTR